MEAAWTKSAKEVLDHLGVDPAKGLSESEVEKRRSQYGLNELEEAPPTPLIELILEQFKDQLVLILLGSAVISFVLAILEENESLATALVEPAVIFAILIANATVGVIQERNADQAIEALKEYSPDTTTVIRDGRTAKIRAAEIVPGDIVSISVGDKIPADCRLIAINSSSFRVDQAILTGESVSVNKDLDAVPDPRAVNQDKTNMLFSGTAIANGSGLAVAVYTGAKTAIGGIHAEISKEDDEDTPLKQKLDEFGDQLARVIGIVCLVVWLINWKHFSDPSHGSLLKGAIYYFKIAVALAVAAIPEGLAAVITACLAIGTKKMAKKNAIVRHLPSVETLGATNVICSDKTGTLTTNQMSVTRFLTFASESGQIAEYAVEGTSFAPIGNITTSDGKTLTNLNKAGSAISDLATVSAVCNDSSVSIDERGHYHAIGQPTEVALRVLTEKLGHEDASVNAKLPSLSAAERANAVCGAYEHQFQRILTLEFSRDRKSMSTLVRTADGKGKLLVKGAPDTVLERCTSIRTNGGAAVPLSSSMRSQLASRVSDYSKDGLRCLALAVIDDAPLATSHYKSNSASDYVRFEQDMTFVGLVGMLDPPRPEVRGAIEKCRNAGIRVIVITGDNKETAETICRRIGVFTDGEDLTGKSFTGREFDDLDDAAKLHAVLNASLFSRTEPSHKLALVQLLQSQGLVTAMTGDGVNDSPALKRADIGIGLGSGTDVAKLASDMILADDKFDTIVDAVEQGRVIYHNVQSFIRYMISSNLGEVASIVIATLMGIPEIMTPLHLLWLNLSTDGPPAVALSANPAPPASMSTRPRSRDEPIVSPMVLLRYCILGAYVGFSAVFGYVWWFCYYAGGPQMPLRALSNHLACGTNGNISCDVFSAGAAHASTMSLTVLVVIEMLNSLNAIAETDSLFVQPPTKNPLLLGAIVLSISMHFAVLAFAPLRDLFGLTWLNATEWRTVFLLALPVVPIDEFLKFVLRTFINPPEKTRVKRAALTNGDKQ